MRRPASKSTDRSQGFTLLELLVALTLFAILMTALLGGIRLGTRVWEVSSADIQNNDQVFAVRSFLHQRLEDISPIIGSVEGDETQPIFVGESERLRLASSMPASLGAGIFILELSLDLLSDRSLGHDLILHWRSWPNEPPSENQRIILDKVVQINFAYFARSEEDPAGKWHESWRGQSLLPELIRVDLRFSSGDRREWQPLIVSPMIDKWYDTDIE